MRSFFFFFFWFLWVGGANVIPQTYFLAVSPNVKEEMVTLLLMLGSVASIIGVWWETRVGHKYSLPKAKYLGLMLVVISFGLLFVGLPLGLYFVCYLCFRFFSCALFQKLDAGICHSAREDISEKHAKHSMLFMLLAVSVAPVFFAFYQNGVLVGAVVFALAATSAIFYRNIHSKNKPAHKLTNNLPMHISDKYFLAYSGAYLAIVFLTSSLLVYFIGDFYGFTSPVKVAGLVMLVISATAVVCCLLYGRFRYLPYRDSCTVWVQIVILGAMALGISLLFLKLSTSFAYVAASAALMGGAYGVFVVYTRSLVVYRARQCGRMALLAWYNVLPFVSSIGIFAVAGGLKLILSQGGAQYYWGIATVLALTGGISLIALWAMNRNREQSVSGVSHN